MNELDALIPAAVARVLRDLSAEANELAADHNAAPAAVYGALRKGLLHALRDPAVSKADMRASDWRARWRVYQDGFEEPIADSDPHIEPLAPGEAITHGLPTVLAEGVDMLGQVHAARRIMTSLGPDDQARILRGFRPTLSRNGGRGTLRVKYAVEGEDGRPDYHLLRIDVERAT